MLADTQTLNIAGANVDFIAVKRNDPKDGSVFMKDGATLDLPEQISVKHAVIGSPGKTGQGASDKHLVSYVRTERDATTGFVYRLVVNATIEMPRVGLFSATEVENGVEAIAKFLTDANVTKLLRGES